LSVSLRLQPLSPRPTFELLQAGVGVLGDCKVQQHAIVGHLEPGASQKPQTDLGKWLCGGGRWRTKKITARFVATGNFFEEIMRRWNQTFADWFPNPHID
jgi:hypothetical protein